MRSVFLFIAFAIFCSHSLKGQVAREVYGNQLMNQFHYAKAFEVWSDLAESEYESWEDKLTYARNAADCALRINKLNEGLKWSELIIQYGDLNYSDVSRHIRFLRGTGRAEDVESLLQSAIKENPEESRFENELTKNALVQQLLSNTSSFQLEKYRPDAESAEFAAFPYESGLVFMTNGIHPSLLGFLDKWTGYEFNKLSLVEDVKKPSEVLPFFDRMRGGVLFDAIDQAYTHMGPVAFNQDETRALMTSNATASDLMGDVDISKLQLNLFQKKEEGWEKDSLTSWNSSKHSYGHGVFASDQEIILMSDRPGGFGGTDLYRTRWDSVLGSWTELENLGEAVNTVGNELFPFVSTAGHLFFASDGHPGAGGLDVFMMINGEEEINHLGYPINTHWDDFAFWFDDLTGDGWLSSNRERNQDALYRVLGEPMNSEVQVSLISCDGSVMPGVGIEVVKLGDQHGAPYLTNQDGMCSFFGSIGVEYEVRVLPLPNLQKPPMKRVRIGTGAMKIELDLNDSNFENKLAFVSDEGLPLPGVLLELQEAGGSTKTVVTDESGVYRWTDDIIGSNVTRATTTLINYLDKAVEFSTPPPGCRSSIDQQIVLLVDEMNELRIDLNLILYDLGSASLRESSKQELDKLVKYLIAKPNIKVELSSHTDCRNDRASNQRLSQARAESCVNYIIAKGIDAQRIIAKGYGETLLVNECSDVRACGCVPADVEDCEECSEAEHQQNRRTELRLLAE